MKINTLCMALLATGIAVPALAVEQQPFTVKDLVKLNKLHSAAVSNDGSKLVYGVKTVAEDGKTDSDLYLLDLTDKDAKPDRKSVV